MPEAVSLGTQLADLDRAAYAPYRDPRDYILSWTDAIWIERGLGRLKEHYAKDVRVHTAYGETYDWDHVVENSLQKFAAFPNGGGGGAEDVIWESRGRNGFISSHRVLKTGTHTGFWTYGPPTGRHWVSRTVAHCLVTDNKISEEWLVRDEWAVLERLGLDPHAIAAKLAESSPVLGRTVAAEGAASAFAGVIADAGRAGVSGRRPDRFRRETELVRGIFEEMLNERMFSLMPRFFDQKTVCNTTRMRRIQGIEACRIEMIDFLASFPDYRIEVRDIAVLEGPEMGLRVAVIWLLRGTYGGVPTYGPITRTPVHVLGASHFELTEDGRVLREFRVVDELAILTQIVAAQRVAGQEGT